jgi:hypothetical protein
MTREELASRAGVTTRTLFNYIQKHLDELEALGYHSNQILSPIVLAWFAKNYGVNVDD